MTVGYFDGFAVAALVTEGTAGASAARIWKTFDAICSSAIIEVEVPSMSGRDIDRFAWVWTLNSIVTRGVTDEVLASAADRAWLGAPTITAVHIASALSVAADHFVTDDDVAASWADVSGLDVLRL